MRQIWILKKNLSIWASNIDGSKCDRSIFAPNIVTQKIFRHYLRQIWALKKFSDLNFEKYGDFKSISTIISKNTDKTGEIAQLLEQRSLLPIRKNRECGVCVMSLAESTMDIGEKRGQPSFDSETLE